MNIMWSYGADFMEQDKNGKWKATFAIGDDHKIESDKMIVAPCSAFIAKLK